MGWPGHTGHGRWSTRISASPCTAPGQRGTRPSSRLTRQEEGGPGGNVDLLQMLQRLGVEEADGGAGGEGHPDAAARLHHVRHAHGLVLVRLEALLWHREQGVGAGLGLPADNPGLAGTRLGAGREPQEPGGGVLIDA